MTDTGQSCSTGAKTNSAEKKLYALSFDAKTSPKCLKYLILWRKTAAENSPFLIVFCSRCVLLADIFEQVA